MAQKANRRSALFGYVMFFRKMWTMKDEEQQPCPICGMLSTDTCGGEDAQEQIRSGQR